jgi:hypothetical protein
MKFLVIQWVSYNFWILAFKTKCHVKLLRSCEVLMLQVVHKIFTTKMLPNIFLTQNVDIL